MATEVGARPRGEPGLPGEPGRRALYFCGSIRGGREDRALYGRIVSRLRRFGAVLTEHVAAAELGARGEAAGARAAGPGGVGSPPLHRSCPRPRKGGRPWTALSYYPGVWFLLELSSAPSRGVCRAGQDGHGRGCCGFHVTCGHLFPKLRGS